LIRGLAVWSLALLLALVLPGHPRAHPLGPFPWRTSLEVLGLLVGLTLLALLLTGWCGPRLGRSRSLGPWEAVPDLLWGALSLLLWPSAWGPPGFPALALAFLLAALPGELRWLAQTLPDESGPLAAWGPAAIRNARRRALCHLLPIWLGARLPQWLTATLVLERILGVRGPGTDWAMRVSYRDRPGMVLWVLGFAAIWGLCHREPS